MSGGGMRVDLSALDEVISKLKGLLNDMGKAKSKAKYETNISQTALGSMEFLESNSLYAAHEKEKQRIETMINGLEELVDKFSTSTSKVRDKYDNQEAAVKQNMGGDSGPAKKGSSF
ncbi:hypothetical protein ACFQVC_31290 [Streptomyces monticola]|uniref:WXG100 family type VII secretion target n=1 Tax=Streptomyces monticola TaxID=2666263 RepID=A0ABW2JRV4_9ACTN